MASLNFFQFKTYLHCRVPRTECEDCGVKQVKVPWARKSSGFTLLMDSMIVILAQHMPAKTVADIYLRPLWIAGGIRTRCRMSGSREVLPPEY